MTNRRVENITTARGWRRWSAAEKQRLVAATLVPGANVSAIAREAGVHPCQLYGWRRERREGEQAGFAPVRIVAAEPRGELAVVRAIEIEFASGARMRITGPVDPATLAAVAMALAGGQP